MKRLTLYLIIISVFIVAEGKIKKCCSPDEVLIYTKDNNETYYECTDDFREDIIPLQTKQEYEVSGFSCENNETCIEKGLDGKIIEINCNNNAQLRYQEPILEEHKCCPRNMVYNTKNRTCEYFYVQSKIFPLRSSHLTNIFVGLPHCDGAIIDILLNSTDRYRISESNHVEVYRGSKIKHVIPLQNTCIDETKSGEIVIRHCLSLNVCLQKTCVRKCCPVGQSLVKFSRRIAVCKPTSWDLPFEPHIYADKGMNSENYGVIHYNCGNKRLRKYNEAKLLPNGTIVVHHTIYSHMEDDYCIDNFFATDDFMKGKSFSNGSTQLFVCVKEDVTQNMYKMVSNVTMIVSSIFLILTLLVYIILPDLQNTHGKIVMCHVASMIVAFIVNTTLRMPVVPRYEVGACLFLGYTMNYAFIATFSWLNVMCFDIWYTFGAVRSRGQKKKRDTKFMWYCLYAFGVSAFFTCITIITNHVDTIPALYKPMIGVRKCFYDTGYGRDPHAKLLYFHLPIVLQIFTNTIFFALTVRYFFSVKSNIKKMSDVQQKKVFLDKKTLITILKLWLIMGISWISEIISSYVHNEYIMWHFFDYINVSQGIFIFLIFILKPRVLKGLKQKFGIKTVKDDTTTNVTNMTSSKQSTFSADSRTNTMINAVEYVNLIENKQTNGVNKDYNSNI